MNRLVLNVKPVVADDNRDKHLINHGGHGERNQKIGLRRTTQPEMMLPLLIMHPDLAEKLRVTIDILPDFIFLFLCALTLGFLMQCSEDSADEASIRELQEARRELQLELAQAIQNYNEVSSPWFPSLQ